LFRPAGSKYFSKNGCVAGILDLKIIGVANVVEKHFKAGIAVSFGGLFGTLSKTCQKRKDLIRSDVFQVSIAKLV
jgi:hypothetical protein